MIDQGPGRDFRREIAHDPNVGRSRRDGFLRGSTGTIDQSNNASGYAIQVLACAYDNQDSEPTPAGCATSSADTSTGNIAFDNVLLGGAGVSDVASSADLLLSTNITSKSATLFVSGGYTLAPSGPAIGTGVATFGGATARATTSGTHDIGAFSFVN